MFALSAASSNATAALAPRSRRAPSRARAGVVARASSSSSSSSSSRHRERDDTDLDAQRDGWPTSLCASLASIALVATSSPGVALAAKPPPTYVAELAPTKGSDVRGRITFETALNKSNQEIVVVTPAIAGLSPGPHGLNVHVNGDVSCDDGACTGESFNPQERPHGGPNSLKKFGASACHFVGEGCLLWRHIGDLGNVVADETGAVGGTFKDQYVSLRDGKENSIARRSVVVRARADDFVTAKDDGDAGAVVAYGTIRPA